MPVPVALAAAGISGLSNLAGNIFGGLSQNSSDRANRDFQLDMWNRNNEYNTPLNQRKRLEAGGFNPNLVYGSGSVANTSSRPPDTTDVRPKQDYAKIGTDIGTAVNTYFNLRQQEQQISNMETLRQLAETKIPTEEEKRNNLIANTAKTSQDYNFKQATWGDNLIKVAGEAKAVQLRNIEQELRNAQLPQKLELEIQDKLQNIQNVRSLMSLREVQKLIQEEELELRQKYRLSYHDDLYARLASKLVDTIAPNLLNKK